MQINMQDYLSDAGNGEWGEDIQLPRVTVETTRIRAMMINEVPPADEDDSFYSRREDPAYMRTVLPLFQHAGVAVNGIEDILARGIYLTTAVKSPKTGYEVNPDIIAAHLPLLEKEIAAFPDLRVIMLMGDVAKKAYNRIAKKQTGRNAIPSGATYKIRGGEFHCGGKRIFPSYIMTGGNILIEKSKTAMISEDIARMMPLIQ